MPLSTMGLWDVERIQAQVKRSLGRVSGALPRAWGLGPLTQADDPMGDRARNDHAMDQRAVDDCAIGDRAIVAARGALIPPLPLLSIVLPTLNEAQNLPQVLGTIPAGIDVVVVDGGSADRTAEVANAWGARVICSAPGRSHQLNRGAAAATGSILLFLHADTRLPEGFEQAIRQTLAQPGVVAGAFRLAINGSGRGLRWVEWGVNLRSRVLQMPYGDQAIFLRAEVFDQMGGFPDLPMMEDFELVRRLRKQGRVALAPAAVVTSDRRWRTLGILRTTLANQAMIAGYFLGIDPHKLARWYRDLGKPH